MLVNEGEWVKKDQVLAIIDNPTDYHSYVVFKKEFELFCQHLEARNRVNRIDSLQKLQLGELQNHVSSFHKSIEDYFIFVNNSFTPKRILQLENQIKTSQRLLASLKKKGEILKQEYAIIQENKSIDEKLLSIGAIAALEINDSEMSVLQKDYQLEAYQMELINTELKIQSISDNIIELEETYNKEYKSYLEDVKQEVVTLKAEIAKWEERYVLKSPIEGKIAFFNYWSDYQVVESGKEVLVVMPKYEELFGIMNVPTLGIGKINEGQNVQIRLDAYPYEEYGIINGVVNTISSISREEEIIVKVNIPTQLHTSYGKEITFDQEMYGEAQIITERLRLIERLTNKSFKDNF